MPRLHHPDGQDRFDGDEHRHAGGTYGFRDQSPAARRSLMRTDQRYEDSGDTERLARDKDAKR